MSKLMVSTRKGLLVFNVENNQVTEHSSHFLGDPVSNVVVDAAGDWYAALNLGHFGPKMQKSTDEGKTWTEMACPAFPESGAGEGEDDKGPKVKQVWVMEALADEPGRILAGTIPGAIFETNDGSASWQLNQPLWDVPQREKWFGGGFDESGVHSIDIHPENKNKWTAAISVGGVWHTESAGDSWELACAGMRAAYMPEDMQDSDDLQDPHRLVRSPTNPNRMWVQHHCGIFVSDDEGKQWRECTPDGEFSFGFGVVVHPTEPDTAWFVPAIKDESRYPKDGALCVLKTTDGGHSFKRITEGLPQTGCYDLIYRHALAIDKAGDCLAMASTTGNCWISFDGGESWQTVSHYLPPVYAVSLVE